MNIQKKSDEKCLEIFLELIEERISISTGFIPEEDGVLRNQVLQISCGDLVTVSAPQPLDVPLIVAPATALGEAVN